MNDSQKNIILEEYCSNGMKKLKQICYPKICQIGGISQMDHDDLYSIALDALRDSVERYDHSKDCQFATFLNGNISRKFSTYVRDKNRIKKSGIAEYDDNGERLYHQNISLDAKIEDDVDWCEKVASDFNLDDEVEKELCLLSDGEDEYSPLMKQYLSKLSKVQIKILGLMKDEYSKEEIVNILHIDSSLYNDSIAAIRTEKNRRCVRSLLGGRSNVR